MGFPDSSVGKESVCNAGDPGSIPGSGRSSGEGIGYPLQYSGLEDSIDCIVHGVTESRTRLSHFHFLNSIAMNKASGGDGIPAELFQILKEDHGIWSHHLMGNRWGNSGNSG